MGFVQMMFTNDYFQLLEEAIARHSGMKDDLHVPPFALFEMASVYMKKPEVWNHYVAINSVPTTVESKGFQEWMLVPTT